MNLLYANDKIIVRKIGIYEHYNNIYLNGNSIIQKLFFYPGAIRINK